MYVLGAEMTVEVRLFMSVSVSKPRVLLANRLVGSPKLVFSSVGNDPLSSPSAAMVRLSSIWGSNFVATFCDLARNSQHVARLRMGESSRYSVWRE